MGASVSNGDEEATFGTHGEVSRSFWDAVRMRDSAEVSHFPGISTALQMLS